VTTRKSLLVYVITRLLIIWVYIIYRSFWQYQFRQINKAEIFKEKFFHVNARVIGSRSIVYSYWVSSLRPYKHQRTPLYWLRYQLLHFTDSYISYSTLLTQRSVTPLYWLRYQLLHFTDSDITFSRTYWLL